MDSWGLLLYALTGTLLASLLACIPALHIYNIAGVFFWLLARSSWDLASNALAMFSLGLVVGYAVVSVIPSVLWAIPDESTIWLVLPGRKYLMNGNGREAIVLSGLGSLGGAVALIVLAPFAARLIHFASQVLWPHMHWLLGAIALYVLLSEWPKGTGSGRTFWIRLWSGWRSILAGLATFFLSGFLGLILSYRPLLAVDVSFQALMPAFVGLFAIPWMVGNIASHSKVPKQRLSAVLNVGTDRIAQGTGAGIVGGLLAVFLPVVTPGIGGLVAGQAIAQRDDRAFLVSQGASRFVYYVGALLALFVPGVDLTRGGMAWMLSPFYRAPTPKDYWVAVSAVGLCSALAFVLLLGASRFFSTWIAHVNYRAVSGVLLAALLALVAGLTGWRGLLVTAAASGIGMIPPMFHSRRVNCMGILFVPILVDMAGLGPAIARLLALA
jgi:putative membrane protein